MVASSIVAVALDEPPADARQRRQRRESDEPLDEQQTSLRVPGGLQRAEGQREQRRQTEDLAGRRARQVDGIDAADASAGQQGRTAEHVSSTGAARWP
jgi:hypothetical protein